MSTKLLFLAFPALFACSNDMPSEARASAPLTAVPIAVPTQVEALEAAAPAVVEAQDKAPMSGDAQLTAQKELEASALKIQHDIEALRGDKFKHDVPVKIADKATLIDYLTKREAIETKPERERFKEECAKLLGLIPPGMDLKAAMHAFLESQVGGFYDPPTKTFYIMDSFGGELGRVIMSHELVHALDDQLYDLDGSAKKLGDDTDVNEAFWAVCEGSGTLTMTQWMLKNMSKLDPTALAEIQKMGVAGMEDLPPFVWKPALAAYTCGQNFLSKAVPKKSKKKSAASAAEESAAKPGEAPAMPTYSEQLAHAFASPPRSCEQILHPEKYWDAAKRDEPRKVAFDVSKTPAGWKELGQDTLGEIALALLTMPRAERKGIDGNNLMAVAMMTYTDRAAEGWGGDRLIVLGQGDARVLQLVTVWDTSEDAREFAAALGTGDESVLVHGASIGDRPCASTVDLDAEAKTVVVRVALAGSKAGPMPAADVRLPWTVGP